MARFQSVSEAFSIAARKTVAETQKILVKVAKREHARIMRTHPRPGSFTRFVDGRQNATEETVKPNGVILYQYPRLEVVAQYAMEVLHDLSPVLSGRYRNSHTLFVNGVAVTSLKGLKTGDEVSIANFVPYARKIEVGRMRMSVPNYVYKRATAKVRARYGNLASITTTFRGMSGGAIITGKAGNKAGLRYPTMLITER